MRDQSSGPTRSSTCVNSCWAATRPSRMASFSVVAPRQARSPGAADSSRSPREEILRVPYGNLRDLVRCSFAWAGVLVRHMPVCCHEGQWYLTDAGLQRLAGELAPMLWRFNANVN